jgi:hypothetical protein
MRIFSLLVLASLCCAAQDVADWQSLNALHPGDKVRLSLRSQTSVIDIFKESSADQVTVGSVVAHKSDVLKVERYRSGEWSRGKTAAVGALIGLGGGATVGAAAGACHKGDFIYVSRPVLGVALGALGAILGAAVGALVPHHRTDLIYAAK